MSTFTANDSPCKAAIERLWIADSASLIDPPKHENVKCMLESRERQGRRPARPCDRPRRGKLALPPSLQRKSVVKKIAAPLQATQTQADFYNTGRLSLQYGSSTTHSINDRCLFSVNFLSILNALTLPHLIRRLATPPIPEGIPVKIMNRKISLMITMSRTRQPAPAILGATTSGCVEICRIPWILDTA